MDVTTIDDVRAECSTLEAKLNDINRTKQAFDKSSGNYCNNVAM